MSGRFVTLEGVEGVGKSTNLEFVRQFLVTAGIDVVTSREPGGTPFAEAIRGIVLDDWEEPVPAYAELFLMFAARCAHIENLIKPALARGAWVVCDRFVDASFAYQAAGRSLPKEHVARLSEWVLGSLRPDLTLLLDTTIDTGRARAYKRDQTRAVTDRFESERASFFARVRDAYLALADEQPQRIKVIDAGLPLPAVQRQIGHELEALMGSQ